jgi:hypothetical protein
MIVPANMSASSVAVTLQDPLEVTKEQFGAFSFPAHPKSEHHRGHPGRMYCQRSNDKVL